MNLHEVGGEGVWEIMNLYLTSWNDTFYIKNFRFWVLNADQRSRN